MSAEEVKIEYFYTEPEYLAASRLYLLGSPSLLGRIAVLFAMILGAAVWLMFLVADFPFWTIIPLVLLLEASLLYNIVVVAPRRFFRGDGKFRDKYHVTFSDDGITVKTTQVDSKLAWSLYTKVIEGAGMYLLVYGKETRMMTMVPKRAFQNRIQEDAFRSLIRRHISDHTRLVGTNSRVADEPEYKPSSLNPPDWR
jgi:YcxB-like protein